MKNYFAPRLRKESRLLEVLPWNSSVETGIYSIGEPMLNQNPYDGYQVNSTLVTLGDPDKYPVAVASCFENGGDYVVAWVHDEGVSIKVRQGHFYDFKPSPIDASGIVVFPNPVDDEIHIQGQPNTLAILFNSMGAKIKEGTLSRDGGLIISVSNLADGGYFVLMDNKVYTIRINHKK